MKIILLLSLLSLSTACEYRQYSYSLSFGVQGSYAEVKYQYPHGPSISVHRDHQLVQEIYLSDDLGKFIEHYTIPNGFALRGENREIQISLAVSETNFHEVKVFRELMRDEQARDCLMFGNDTFWYGGPEQYNQQYWPIEQQSHQDRSYVPKEDQSMAIVERIWLNSKGVYAYVDFDVPLFISQTPYEVLCLKAAKASPYNQDESRFTYTYYIGVASDPREAYLKAVEQHLGKPTGIPDERMALLPIFSTWARYLRDIDEAILRNYAAEIRQHEFKDSQFEIDDFWEVCYGSLTINEQKFPNMKQLTDDLKADGFRITMWIHPFINKNCQPWYDEALAMGYLTADADGNTDVSWWNSGRDEAGHIDFTNPEAMAWFMERIQQLKEISGVDSFKFDAGETSFARENAVLQGDKTLLPSLMTRIFVDNVTKFGSFIEVRVGWGTQHQPVFVRMLDKDSHWSIERNGLRSLIPTLLQMNLNGYPFVLSDMIGGNAYNGTPSQELYLRWIETTTFMPAMQYSITPWDYDVETTEIARHYNDLHETVAGPVILAAMRKAVEDGTPVNPPVWWVAPEDQIALGIGDQFLLGESILVAPVMEENTQSRNIYLPAGTWKAPDETIYEGPIWLEDYPAPIGHLPYFTLQPGKKKNEL